LGTSGVLLVAGRLGSPELLAQSQASAGAAINAFIAIAPDGNVTLQCAHSEMGQGITTTFAAILADELQADWSRCRVVFSPAAASFRHPKYNWQFTGNAESIRSYHDLIRRMGAAARAMLTAAAADRLGVASRELVARSGRVHHRLSGRALDFGEIAAAAALLQVPADPPIKPESEWQLVGQGRSLQRRDVPAKVDGSAIFGIDVKVAGMVYAAVLSAPTIGGTPAHVDDVAARALPGVLAIVPMAKAVAVVAEHYWQARRALELLNVTWEAGEAGAIDDFGLDRRYRDAFGATAGWVEAEKHGDAPSTLTAARGVVEVEYQSPWLSHSPMEPMNATVSVQEDGATVWAPTQGPQMTQVVLAGVLNIAPDAVVVHRTYLGGGFGRRLLADFVAQAAICSKTVGRPVKVIWSREEDIKQDWFRPAFVVRSRAALDASGYPSAIHHRLAAPSILRPVSPTPIRPGMVDGLAVEGLVEHPYAISNRRIDYHMLEVPIPTMVLRTTGHGPNNFALESLIDELAVRAGSDGYQYRRRLLAGSPAALAVVDRAAELAGWGKARADRFVGMAFADCFGTYLCQVVELSIVDGAVELHRVTSVCDPGRVFDRVNARSNIEGGVVWGLSAALYSSITFANGHTRERNFDGFQVVTLPDTPELVTDFLENRSTLGGIGEVGPVAVPAALCNALFAATGRRIRRLPLTREGVRTVYGKIYN
jgi:isoquinoline 1-oxidoreductase beta subunit